MGYNTTFKGTLKFGTELTVPMLHKLESILGEDVRDHPEWNSPEEDWLSYIDLETTPGYTGLQWNNQEKTYHMEKAVALVIRLMREEFPEFYLEGKFLCMGDIPGDIYYIYVEKDRIHIEEVNV